MVTQLVSFSIFNVDFQCSNFSTFNYQCITKKVEIFKLKFKEISPYMLPVSYKFQRHE